MFSLQGTVGCTGLPSNQIIMEKKNQIKRLQQDPVLAIQITSQKET